jgi:hypothetical protein
MMKRLVELDELDQVAGWVPKLHPARVVTHFDTPRQLNPVSFQVFNRSLQILNSKGNQREMGWL